MRIATKIIWIVAVMAAIAGLLWFLYLLLYSRTRIGPAGPYILYFIWVPTLSFVISSIVLLVKGIVPNIKIAQIVLVLFLIIFSHIFSGTLLSQPSWERQMREAEESNRKYWEENSRITADGKYQYSLELTGMLTENPRAYVSIHDMANDKNMGGITIALNFEGIRPHDELIKLSRALFSELSPTDSENIYILTTTPYLKEEIEVFEIDMVSKTSRKIE